MPNYNQPRQFYAGVDLHARSMFVHILSHKGKTVFERDLPAEPNAFIDAIEPFRKNLVVEAGNFLSYSTRDDRTARRASRAMTLIVSLRHTSDPARLDWPPGR